MKNKVNYRVSKYSIDDIPETIMGLDSFASSLLIGLRLEDLKSDDDAFEAGFEKIDEITFIRKGKEKIEATISQMHSIFISSYIFQADDKGTFDFERTGCEPAKFIKDFVVGPLNGMKYKREKVEILTDSSVFFETGRIIMLDSMEPLIGILDKEL
jgi:hypothetical protein